MKTLYSFLGGMAAAAVAFAGVNEFVLDNALPLLPALTCGAAFGFLSSLALNAFGVTKTVQSGIVSALGFAGFVAVLAALSTLSPNAGAGLLSFAGAVGVFGFIGFAGGVGNSLGGKLG